MQFTNIDSTAISSVAINGTDVAITYKGSGKTYNYLTEVADFAVQLQNVIENNQSVGRFINKAIKEDQTLRLTTV